MTAYMKEGQPPPRHLSTRVGIWATFFAPLVCFFVFMEFLAKPLQREFGWWSILITVALIPMMLQAYWPTCRHRRRLARRLKETNGALCPDCGYDLRGHDSPTPCPECGRAWDREKDRTLWKNWIDY
jgi:hypothetical protein